MHIDGPVFDMKIGRPGGFYQIISVPYAARFLDKSLEQSELDGTELGRANVGFDHAQGLIDFQIAKTQDWLRSYADMTVPFVAKAVQVGDDVLGGDGSDEDFVDAGLEQLEKVALLSCRNERQEREMGRCGVRFVGAAKEENGAWICATIHNRRQGVGSFGFGQCVRTLRQRRRKTGTGQDVAHKKIKIWILGMNDNEVGH